MTDKPFNYEEYTRERLRQTTEDDQQTPRGSKAKEYIARQSEKIEADQQTIADLKRSLHDLTPGGSEFANSPANCIRFVRERLATTGKLAAERNSQRQTITDLEATIVQQQARIEALEHSQSAIAWAEQLHRAQIAELALAELRKALEALLRQTNNIEVLGEWSAEDRNHAMQKKVRAEVDAVKAQALAAIAATEEASP